MGNFGSRGGLRHAVPVKPEGVSRKKDAALDQSATEVTGSTNEAEPFIDLRCRACPDLLTDLAGAAKSRIDDDG